MLPDYCIINNFFEFSFQELVTIIGKEEADKTFSCLYTKDKRHVSTIWPVQTVQDKDTAKYVFELFGGNKIETVYIQ